MFLEYFNFLKVHSNLWKGERRAYAQTFMCKNVVCYIIHDKEKLGIPKFWLETASYINYTY